MFTWINKIRDWQNSLRYKKTQKGEFTLKYIRWWYQDRVNEEAIYLGQNTHIATGVKLDASDGKITIGDNCWVHPGAMLLTYGGFIEIGDNSTINPYVIIYGHGGVKIGCGVRIAAHTVIIPSNHIITRIDRPIYQQGLTKKGIDISNDVWIGTNVTILDGVTIGQGCVIAAGAVVNIDIPPFSIAGGVPVKILKSRIAEIQ